MLNVSGLQRVASMKVHGVTIASHAFPDVVTRVRATYSVRSCMHQPLYAVRVLRAHGMTVETLQRGYRYAVFAKNLLYAART